MGASEGNRLIDAPLAPDPNADEEMGPGAEAIADEDVRGSRLLLVRRAVEPVDLDGLPGGLVELACTFQPAPGARFTSARLVLSLAEPRGVVFAGVAPRNIFEGVPATFVLDARGRLEVAYPDETAGGARGCVVYRCPVVGSGEATRTARWDFSENATRKDGLAAEQVLALTVPVVGKVAGTVSVAARLVRPGLAGGWQAIRDLVLGPRPGEYRYPIAFEVPPAPLRPELLPAPGGELDDEAYIEVLRRIQPAEFALVVMRMGIGPGVLAGAQAEQAIGLVQWARNNGRIAVLHEAIRRDNPGMLPPQG